MQWTKYLAEKCLTDSGMKYLIVRPVGLVLDFPKELAPTEFTLSQGDTIEGKIHRSTVGKVVVDTMLDKKIPDDTTFECMTKDNQFLKPYNYIDGSIKLRGDTEEDKRLVDHIVPKRIVLSLIYSFAALLGISTFFLARYTFKNRNRIFSFFNKKFKN